MKNSLRSFTLMALSGVVLTFASCSKDDPATPQGGTIAGQITPAAAVTTVTATPASGTATTATPSSTGAYSLGGLAAGTYTVTYTPAAGYAAPASQQATVTAGNTTTLAPTNVATSNSPGTMTFTMNGTAVTPSSISSSYSGNTFSLNGIGFTGGVSLSVQSVTGTGTFPITMGSATSGSAGYFINQGSMVITSWNLTTRRASGTFTASGTAASGTGTVSITNGAFTNVRL